MEGLLSRQSIADRQWAHDDNESSDSDDDTSTSRPRAPAQPQTNGAAAARPPSPPSPRSPMSPRSPLNGCEMGAMKNAVDEKDQRIRELEMQNQMLRARLAALEAGASNVPTAPAGPPAK